MHQKASQGVRKASRSIKGGKKAMKLTIEEKLQIALTKNPLTRDRLFLKVLKPSIEKCIYILLKNNKRYTRLHDADDLIQEANLTVLKVIQNQDMSKIKYALRTYLLGAIKRRIWGVVREEFALKRQAQHKAYPLDVLVQLKRVPQNIKPLNTGKENTMLEHFETKDIIFRIKEKLKSSA